MHDFTAEFLKCVKFHGKSFGNSRTTQTLFRGAALMQTKKFQNNEYLLHYKPRLKTVNVNYLVLKCDT